MSVIDAPLLLSTLRKELRAAWQHISTHHAQDGLYGFGVYTTDEASYLLVTAFSEAGLERVVARHMADDRPGAGDAALYRQSLRWSPCDSPLHELGADLLPESDRLVQPIDALLVEESRRVLAEDDDDDDDGFEEDTEADLAIEDVIETAVQALQALDREGVFGTGAERERLVLGLWKGDQSNAERHAYAKALNPPAVARRFGEELNAGVRAFYAQHFPQVKAPEDDVFE